MVKSHQNLTLETSFRQVNSPVSDLSGFWRNNLAQRGWVLRQESSSLVLLREISCYVMEDKRTCGPLPGLAGNLDVS